MGTKSASARLPSGGLIDRTRRLAFRYNGRPMSGYEGDSVASALLANGVRIFGRSLKYHRPRGVMAAGLDDPNSMLSVRDAYGHDAAIRATQVRLAEGMEVASVSGWPTARFDLGAVAQWAQPFMGAGFYYKSFMWPRWMLFEPFFRKAAGYGTPDPSATMRPREHRHETCDVLVIGAGPAGLSAARSLQGSRLKVIVADQAPRLGGGLNWSAATVGRLAAAEWAAREGAALAEDAHTTLLTDTVVAGAYEGDVFTLLQSRFESGQEDRNGGVVAEILWKVRARHVVLASGATERPLVFDGNDRPGVMLASAVVRLAMQFAVAPAQPIAVFTNGDDGYEAAISLQKLGLEIAAVIDTRAGVSAGRARAEARHIRIYSGHEIVSTAGYGALRSVTVAPIGGGAAKVIPCSTLAVAGGWNPLIHLAAHRGCVPEFSDSKQAFICPRLPEGWRAAGSVTGRGGVATALEHGMRAAQEILADSGFERSRWTPPEVAENDASASEPFWRASRGRTKRMWVDFQNDVTVSDIETAAAEGYRSVELLKRYTTLGMGTDQGKSSNVNGIAIMAGIDGRNMQDVGTTTFRPPFTAVRIGTIADSRQGLLFRPPRFLPAHESHRALGAVFEDFGWLRPDWYRSNATERDAAVAAEMNAVRTGVGIFDGSPLGKIEVSGPDAADFLNRFYVSNITTLKPGRIRYSAMLREDGIIFDDGVVARVDENFFIIGPTSGNADFVSNWLERWRQTEWPNLRVSVAAVTPNWACVAVSGPRARDVLTSFDSDIDFSAAAFPHMNIRLGQFAGVPTRIQRVSFTGERQYEVTVPARFGRSLYDRLLTAGRNFGGRPVGMEAWLRLRLEKGYLHVGSDTNGRTLPRDVGMGTIADRKTSDFLGRRSLRLPSALVQNRETLVGLRALAGAFHVGGRIVASGETKPPYRTDGYVASACYSPTLGRHIGLALIERGQQRLGETVRIFDGGAELTAEICKPPFYDPEDQRLEA